ncbi:membrane lipoprotein lipid attachment site-containing protein [Ferriphaselus sp. R-1]|uniref:lipoprotein n=1 Tax=Ferriphaselus sp. R-1 TaxID=1485544 RepID=UPI001267B7A4|nr:membrane lipoprotein lipid attachment site-containing protein [Ferriphaselus sp. R-1]
MKKSFVLLSFVLMLAACSAESDAPNAVRAVLSYPDSAEFGEFTLISNDAACITLNAKNASGEYIGDMEAFLLKGNEERVRNFVESSPCYHSPLKNVLAERKSRHIEKISHTPVASTPSRLNYRGTLWRGAGLRAGQPQGRAG